jgi:hypothetical protein
MVQRLGRAVPDLARHVAGDATSLNGRAKKNAEEVAREVEQGLPQPSGGRKEHKDDDGKVTKVVEWFGYEPNRETIKYRCPARHQDWACLSDAQFNDWPPCSSACRAGTA